METDLRGLMQDSASGFECEIDTGDIRFHCMIPSGFFLSAPPIAKNPHDHPFFEIHFMQSGSVTVFSDERTCILEKNDLALIPPHVYHNAVRIEEEVRVPSFFFSYEKNRSADAQNGFYEVFDALLSAQTAPMIFKQAFGMSHALLALLEEMGKNHPCKETRLKVRITEILLQLIDLVCPDERGSFSESFSQSTREKMAIDAYFANNAKQDLSLKDLSELIFLSERQTNRVLQVLYKLPYKQKLIETRVHMAKYLLATTALPVEEISRKCGYRSPVGFHAAFRSVAGTTPAKYRAQAKTRFSASEK